MEKMVVDKKKYKMGIDEVEKNLRISVNGLIREGDAEEYMGDFQSVVGRVEKGYYTLLVDGTHQSVVPASVVGTLDETLKFYMSLGFEKVTFIKPKSKIAEVQIRNALKRVGYDGVVLDH